MKKRPKNSKTRKELLAENQKLLKLLTIERVKTNSFYGIGRIYDDRYNAQKLVISGITDPLVNRELQEIYMEKQLMERIRPFIITAKDVNEFGREVLTKSIYVFRKDDENGGC